MSFAKKWEKKDDPSTYDKVVESIKPSDPLKTKLMESIRRIELENQRLDQAYSRFQEHDKALFDKAVESYKVHDDKRASIYANEVAEIRKIERMLLQTKLALEQIALRMRTSTELGDVAASLLPVVETMNDLKLGIASINPQTEKGMGDLGDLLSGMVANVGVVTMGPINFEAVNDDASKILGEAQFVAESKISNGFPPLPGETTGQSVRGEDSKP
jgi:division protein CdvB (Snf7/Vps24/ESCRT-III family)